MSLFLVLAAVATLEPLSLAAAIERALRANPELESARRHRAVVESGVVAAGALPNPVVGFTVGRDDPTAAVMAGMRFPVFGQRAAAVSAAEAGLAVTDADVATRVVALRAAVRRAYALLAAAEAQAVLVDETAGIADQLATLTARKFDEGAAPKIEADLARLTAHRARQEALDRAAEREQARVRLATLLGALDRLPDATDPLALPAPPPLEELAGRVDVHPEVAMAKAEGQAATARGESAKAAVRPVPDVLLEVGRLATLNTVGVRATVGIEVPLLYANEGAVQQAGAEASQASADATAATTRRTGALLLAWRRFDAARQRFRFYDAEQVPEAARVEALSRLAYQEGRAPLLSVLAAQAERAAARSRAVDALADANLAVADLEEASGEAL